MGQWTIQEITYHEVLPIWQMQLWPGRESPIEPVSAIDEFGNIDPELMHTKPNFLGCYNSSGGLVGVVSGFPTSTQAFRSRGLWVEETHRKLGIGAALIKHIQTTALGLGYQYLWTMARHSSLAFYQKVDFVPTRELHQYEFGPHFICIKKL